MSARVRARATTLAAAAVIAGCLVVAALVARPASGIEVRVYLDGCARGERPPCLRPLAARIRVVKPRGGEAVAAGTAGADGRISFLLGAGDYVLVPLRAAQRRVKPPARVRVAVRTGQTSRVTLRYRRRA